MRKNTYKKRAQQVTRPSEGRQIRRQTLEVKQTSWRGHLPADEMAKYEAIEPGFASRLLNKIEEEQQHRHKMESKIVNLSFMNEALRYIIVVVAIGMVCYLCYFAFQEGYSGAAATIATSVIVGLAAVILKQNIPNRKK